MKKIRERVLVDKRLYGLCRLGQCGSGYPAETEVVNENDLASFSGSMLDKIRLIAQKRDVAIRLFDKYVSE